MVLASVSRRSSSFNKCRPTSSVVTFKKSNESVEKLVGHNYGENLGVPRPLPGSRSSNTGHLARSFFSRHTPDSHGRGFSTASTSRFSGRALSHVPWHFIYHGPLQPVMRNHHAEGLLCAPSTGMFAPLIQRARSESRKTATSAISDGVANLPHGNSSRSNLAKASGSMSRN